MADEIDELFDYIVQNNLTQAQMAEKLNLSRSMLTLVLNRKKPLSKRVKRKFEMLSQDANHQS
mgnify:CR=1 FL=1